MSRFSINTDYRRDDGNPAPALRRIAEAGFSHVHWCHHWGDDFVYARAEIDQIGRWLREFGLVLNDLHGSEGREKHWLSPEPWARAAGAELVENRIEMTARLGSDRMVLHLPAPPDDAVAGQEFLERLDRALERLLPVAAAHGVRIAFENLFPSNHRLLDRILAHHGDGVGLCYDSGHGRIVGDGLDLLERQRDRLLALHLNDNDATWDQHQLPYAAGVDWPRLAAALASAPYDRPLGLEVSMAYMAFRDEGHFLAAARASLERLEGQIAAARRSRVPEGEP